MTGPSLTGVPGTTVGSLLSDESAVERLFRSHFSTLCAEATSHLRPELGDAAPAAAPRVVESTFRQAWEEREHITTDAELTAFLHETVHRCAARELSRRAKAHHLRGSATGGTQHSVAPCDVNESWGHVQRVLHPEAVREEAKAYTEKLRHEAAEHVGDLSKDRSWKVPLIILGIGAAIVLGGMWWLTRLGQDRAITRALNSAEARNLAAANGQTGTLTLDDATQVTLAPGSKLTIPERFGDEMRAVKIDGAARFVVSPGHPRPFEVRAGNAAVVVTGTTITVRAYQNDPAVIVRVTDGDAVVKVGKDQHPVAAGRAALIESNGRVREPSPDELALATNWVDRRVTIKNRELRDVVREMNRLYGLDIKVPEVKLLGQMASVDAPLDSMRLAISQVEQSAGVVFGYEGQTMVFRAKQEPARPGSR